MRLYVKVLLLLFSFCCLKSYGQHSSTICKTQFDTLTQKRVYSFVDQMPKPIIGEIELLKKLSQVKYSSKSIPASTKVVIAFIVEPNGKISGKRVIKDIKGSNIGIQALKLIESIKWTAGSCSGTSVPVIQIIPIQICLNKD